MARFAPGFDEPSDFPAGWQREPGGDLLCPACIRGREVADRREAARGALVQDPDATDREIAERVRASGHPTLKVGEVTTARRELIAEGVILSAGARARARRRAERPKLQRPKPERSKPRRRRPLIERHAAIAAELRRDPRRGNGEVAAALGCRSESTVRRVRWALEAAGAIEVHRGNGRKAAT